MVEIADIKDSETLEAWLLEQPEEKKREYAVKLAYRCGMRIFPNLFNHSGSEYAGIEMPMFRNLLIAVIAGQFQPYTSQQAPFIATPQSDNRFSKILELVMNSTLPFVTFSDGTTF